MENTGLITMRIRATSKATRTEVAVRKHQFIIDEPESMGGTDSGPNPLEYVLGALSGCENIIAGRVAKEMNFQLNGIKFDIRGTVDPRGMSGDPTVRPYFQQITIRAVVDTPEDESRLKQFQETVDLRCPVYTMLKQSGVELDTEWVKA